MRAIELAEKDFAMSNAGYRETTFKSVTRGQPCAVCDGIDGCSRGEDGLILCRRRSGQQPGFVYLGQSQGDEQWALFRHEGDPNLEQNDDAHRRNGHRNNDTSNGHASIDWGARALALNRNLTPDLRAELAQALGLPEAALCSLLIGYEVDVSRLKDGHTVREACWSFPETDGLGKVIGIGRRFRDKAKGFIVGGHRGLILAEGWENRPGPILLPEGASCTLAATAMNLPAIGRPSNTGGIDHLTRIIRSVPPDRDIIVLGEFDPNVKTGKWPGRDGAVSTAGQLTAALGRPVHWTLPPTGAKDLRHWTTNQGLDPALIDEWHEAGERFLSLIHETKKKADPNQQTAAAGSGGFQFEPVDICDLIELYPTLRPPIIHGLLREGETMNIISGAKIGKSWLTIDLAFAVALGIPWFGFDTTRGKVLVIDNELHPETITYRLGRVAQAREIDISQMRDCVKVLHLRGRLQDINAIGRYLLSLTPGEFLLVVIDATYRTLPSDVDENSNSSLAMIYNSIDRYAGHLKAAFALIHHATKGDQSQRVVTDVGSGAGAQSRAVDTHCVLRPHEEESVAVLDAVCRSWPAVSSRCLRWDFPLFRLDESVDPKALKRGRGWKESAADTEAKRAAKSEKDAATQRDQESRLLDALDSLVDGQGVAVYTRVRVASGLGGDTMERTVYRLQRRGLVEEIPTTTRIGNGSMKTVKGLRRKPE